ncbi:MAG: BON domain-containing protein [Planctomycetaceae bacterium]|jgi:hypothetical protein|nr:BON domain-containing protein [Planctomycetaceae bacterium]
MEQHLFDDSSEWEQQAVLHPLPPFGVLCFVYCVLSLILLLPAVVLAQSGNGSNTDSTGTTSSTGSSDSAFSGSTDSSAFSETVETPTYQGLEDNSSRGFIGSSAPGGFVGVDEIYDSFAPANSTNSRSATTTTRRTTASTTRRTTTNRNLTNRTSSSNSQQLVRSSAVTDFDYVRPQTAQRITAMQTHLQRIRGLQGESVNIEQTPSGTVVTLTGTVKSERDSKLARQLILLEPGIDRVENKLTVTANE